MPDPARWFLPWSSTEYPDVPAGSGRPWGDMTAMAGRESKPAPDNRPWDEGCRVTALIGGYESTCSMRETLEAAIALAPSVPAAQRPRVYLTDWRLDPLRDLSDGNPWRTTRAWTASDTAVKDQTAAGLILRMMQAGINVRVMVWYPVTVTRYKSSGWAAHVDGHLYLARLVQKECERLNAPGRGVVALDLRVAAPLTATHHQKTLVIRVGSIDVAYVGGVDWAFTRRDAPDATRTWTYDPDAPNDPSKPGPFFLGGDWQSGDTNPAFIQDSNNAQHRWPMQAGVNYGAVPRVSTYDRPPSDLPEPTYSNNWQSWHDQHLKLEGPIVKTIEDQFRERWRDSGDAHDLGFFSGSHWHDNQVIFSSNTAFQSGIITDLPEDTPVAAVPGASSMAQLWRTIPLRTRSRPPFQRGEFTIMAGISRACQKSTELIWIFDQFFFSRPLGRLLNTLVKNAPGQSLHAIVVLPPHADASFLDEHRARKLALQDLVAGLQTSTPGVFNRVAVYNLWDHDKTRGIYCHAKVQTYDQQLLVCGSANLNRRSFTCDTEIDCAVHDPVVVARHQQRLWKLLFPRTPWPATINFAQPGWGGALFTQFVATATNQSFLEPDPWWREPPPQFSGSTRTIRDREGNQTVGHFATATVVPPRLPNGVAREQDYGEDLVAQARAALGWPDLSPDAITISGQSESPIPLVDMEPILEPSSVTFEVERAIGTGSAPDPGARGRLDEIVYLIEGCVEQGKFPWRHS